ncbi:hypothetical protein RFI_14073, partial [Reticulomyxa filosa]
NGTSARKKHKIDDEESLAKKSKKKERQMIVKSLERRLTNRMKPRELVQRGLTREEYLKMDKEQADKTLQKARQSIYDDFSRQFDELHNPFYQFEIKGIVPQGYFQQRAQEICSGHRKQESVLDELNQKLLEKPDFAEVVAEGILENLNHAMKSERALTTGNRADWEGTILDELTSEESETFAHDDERRRLQALARHISQRPDRKELLQKNILFSIGIAPAIQTNAKKLQQRLEHRKSIDDVRALGILHWNGEEQQSQTVRSRLEKVEMTPRQLNKSIKQRPDRDELKERGVL